ncbi:hypothetical protein JCM5296_002219, partial [Sporobolomyces johnsonii]
MSSAHVVYCCSSPNSSAATNASSTVSSTAKAVISAWNRVSQADRTKVLQSSQDYYRATGFEDGKAPGSKTRAIYSDPATSCSTALLASAAHTLQSPEQEIPEDTLRLTITTPSASAEGPSRHLHPSAVRDAIIAHYNGGAVLPPVPGYGIADNSPYRGIVRVVDGTRVHAVNAGRNGSLPSYAIDVAFNTARDLEAALEIPFAHHGKTADIAYALPASLSGVVELRIELKNLKTDDAAITKAVCDALRRTPNAKVLKIVKHYDATRSLNAPNAVVFQGRLAVYTRLDSVPPDDAGAYRQRLAALLPSSIQIGSATLPAGHTASACTNPTGRASRTAGPFRATAGAPRATTSASTPLKPAVAWSLPVTPSRHLRPTSSGSNLTPLSHRNSFAALSDESDESDGVDTEVEDNA